MRPALVVVDVQNDFCEGGALAVKGGDKVVPPLNRAIRAFAKAGLPTFFTRDWHPPDHISFKSQGGIWPAHCVQGTAGAGFHQDLDVPATSKIINKGDKPAVEAYSGFQGTDLEWQLKDLDIDEIYLGGLATDYCVKETCLDAIRDGFKVNLLTDCIRAVDAKSGDGTKALKAMRNAGARMTSSTAAINQMASTQQ